MTLKNGPFCLFRILTTILYFRLSDFRFSAFVRPRSSVSSRKKDYTMDEDESKKKDNTSFIFKSLFLITAGGLGLFGGFANALGSARKQDPNSFDKGLIGDVAIKEAKAQQQKRVLHEAGTKLAARALGYGTLYAVAGCSLIFYSLWKLSGAKDLAEFRLKAGRILPKVPKNDPPQSRTEFSGINDFLQYVIDKDMEEKALKKEAKQQ